eukprot:sb/3472561/
MAWGWRHSHLVRSPHTRFLCTAYLVYVYYKTSSENIKSYPDLPGPDLPGPDIPGTPIYGQIPFPKDPGKSGSDCNRIFGRRRGITRDAYSVYIQPDPDLTANSLLSIFHQYPGQSTKHGRLLVTAHEPTETSKQPIRTRNLGHVTGYHPIRDQYFLIRSVPKEF